MSTAPPNIIDESRLNAPPVNALEAAQKPSAEFQSNLPVDFFPNVSAPKGAGGISVQDIIAENEKITRQRVQNVAAQNKEHFRGLLDDLVREQAGKNVGTLDESGVSKKTLDDFLQRHSERQELQSKDILLQGSESVLNKIFASQQQQAGFNQQKSMQELQFEQTKIMENISTGNQQKLLTFQQGLANGINPDTGQAFTDVEVQQRMTEFNAGIEKDLAAFTLGAQRGVNPTTGQAYTDNELANLAVERQVGLAEKDAELKLQYDTDLLALQNGVDAEGNPLTSVEAQAQINKLQADFQAEMDQKAFEAALIAEFGVNGVQIGQELAEERGENAQIEIDFLTGITGEQTMSDSAKNAVIDLVDAGVSFNDAQIITQIPSESETFKTAYVDGLSSSDISVLNSDINAQREFVSPGQKGLSTNHSGYEYSNAVMDAIGISFVVNLPDTKALGSEGVTKELERLTKEALDNNPELLNDPVVLEAIKTALIRQGEVL